MEARTLQVYNMQYFFLNITQNSNSFLNLYVGYMFFSVLLVRLLMISRSISLVLKFFVNAKTTIVFA